MALHRSNDSFVTSRAASLCLFLALRCPALPCCPALLCYARLSRSSCFGADCTPGDVLCPAFYAPSPVSKRGDARLVVIAGLLPPHSRSHSRSHSHSHWPLLTPYRLVSRDSRKCFAREARRGEARRGAVAAEGYTRINLIWFVPGLSAAL